MKLEEIPIATEINDKVFFPGTDGADGNKSKSYPATLIAEYAGGSSGGGGSTGAQTGSSIILSGGNEYYTLTAEDNGKYFYPEFPEIIFSITVDESLLPADFVAHFVNYPESSNFNFFREGNTDLNLNYNPDAPIHIHTLVRRGDRDFFVNINSLPGF